ncbi:amidase domain-containing protein [Nonomuraea indica]|uniref:Amidase domain-containing protein n=1 Tax=Nonomuraea indica TaxID=1581193 RepID=A0ABW7ZVU4_9ACTN
METRKTSFAYDYAAMEAYALQYWGPDTSDYNQDFRTYDNDCTNFMSQIVLAGGWTEVGAYPINDRTSNSNWWYNSLGTFATTYTWAGAHNWYFFAQQESQRTSHIDNVYKALVTDIIQVDWSPTGAPDGTLDHTMIVTDRDPGDDGLAVELYLTYHTSNQKNKSLSRIKAERPNTIWYAHRT